MTDGFVPLVMQPGWILERYYGWRVLEEGGTLKLLARRRGPLRTFLLFVQGAPEEALEAVARRHGLAGPLSIARVADLAWDPGTPQRRIAGRAFRRVEGERFLGLGTFVVDLAEDEDLLWRRVAARERAKCRQIERRGARVELFRAPDAAQLAAFVALYGRLARAKGLEPPLPAALATMARRDELLLAHCRDAKGATLVMNLAYRAHGQGYFLHGARAGAVPPGAGHLTQWETVRALKALGLRFYDLGLVRSLDEADGIRRFKRSLGGSFIPFGAEYRRVPWLLDRPYRLFRRLRQRRRTAAEDAGE